ncbi:hypothetical protein EMCRGX_G008484 [Ephydatia muelleri]
MALDGNHFVFGAGLADFSRERLTRGRLKGNINDIHIIDDVFAAKVPPKESEWVDVFKNAQDSCPNVLQLVDLLLSLPASSANCERGIQPDYSHQVRLEEQAKGHHGH